MKIDFKSSVLVRTLSLLQPRDQRKLALVVLIQIIFGFLDLLGVAAIGMIGALTVTGIQNGTTGNRVTAALTFLNLSDNSFQQQVIILGIAASVLLVGKTIFSIIFTRKIMLFLSRRGASISSELFSKLASSDLLTIQHRPTQETVFAVTYGVERLTLGVLAVAVTLISDTALLMVMSFGLFVVDPGMAISTAIVFGIVAISLYKFMGQKATNLGLSRSVLEVSSNETIVEFLGSYREIVVRDRRNYYSEKMRDLRYDLADLSAKSNFMPNISKFALEITLVLGGFALCSYQFYVSDAARAVAVLSIFLAATTRIGPAVLRIQQGAVVIKGSLGGAEATFNLMESLKDSKPSRLGISDLSTSHDGFSPEVELSKVSFTYATGTSKALDDIDLTLNSGRIYAVVGPSGAGKTTLADILLGIFPPSSGQVLISGCQPSETVIRWPGAIGYVPQEVLISGGTIRQVVAQGFPKEQVSDTLIWECLRLAQLESWVNGKPNGLDFEVGNRGSSLSGGQRQRLGIARALLTKPSLIILDEATSSLDGKTEADISDAIQALRGTTTVVLIAHRLSTVRQADQVVYMENGKIHCKGTFNEVRNLVPNFEVQAQLMGL